jgi:hypothetical protein
MIGVWVEDGEMKCACEQSEECTHAPKRGCNTLVQIKKAMARLKQEVDVRGNERLWVKCANPACGIDFQQEKVSQIYHSRECGIAAQYQNKLAKKKKKMTLAEKDAKIKELIREQKISYGKAVAIVDGYVEYVL